MKIDIGPEKALRVVEALAAASACLFSSVLENKHRCNAWA